MKRTHCLLTLACITAGPTAWNSVARAQSADELLPDMIVDPSPLRDTRIDTETLPGRRLLRLSTATPNVGLGVLEVRGSTVLAADRQEVLQRIYRSDGSWWERVAGISVYHPTHAHTHFDGWAVYRLRARGTDGGVGAVVATGDKTSFCLLDTNVYTGPEVRVTAGAPRYLTCGQAVQGISAGWADVYDRELDGQWIDITNVSDGDYWLEAEVDPEQRILEVAGGEGNNVARVPIVLGAAPDVAADRFEPNDTLATSADLGSLDARRELEGLTLEGGADYYRLSSSRALPAGAHVSIEASNPAAVQLSVLDAAGGVIRSAAADEGRLSLADLGPGALYLRVAPVTPVQAEYRLTIDPSANQAPSIQLITPGDGVIWIEHSYAALPVRWMASDPEGDPISVSLFVDRDTVDGDSLALGGYSALPGESHQASVNTAALDVGDWYLLARASDESGFTEARAAERFVVYVKGDLDFDADVDRADWVLLVQRRRAHRDLPLSEAVFGWEALLDMDRDGDVDDVDVNAFRSRALNPLSSHSH